MKNLSLLIVILLLGQPVADAKCRGHHRHCRPAIVCPPVVQPAPTVEARVPDQQVAPIAPVNPEAERILPVDPITAILPDVLPPAAPSEPGRLHRMLRYIPHAIGSAFAVALGLIFWEHNRDRAQAQANADAHACGRRVAEPIPGVDIPQPEPVVIPVPAQPEVPVAQPAVAIPVPIPVANGDQRDAKHQAQADAETQTAEAIYVGPAELEEIRKEFTNSLAALKRSHDQLSIANNDKEAINDLRAKVSALELQIAQLSANADLDKAGLQQAYEKIQDERDALVDGIQKMRLSAESPQKNTFKPAKARIQRLSGTLTPQVAAAMKAALVNNPPSQNGAQENNGIRIEPIAQQETHTEASAAAAPVAGPPGPSADGSRTPSPELPNSSAAQLPITPLTYGQLNDPFDWQTAELLTGSRDDEVIIPFVEKMRANRLLKAKK